MPATVGYTDLRLWITVSPVHPKLGEVALMEIAFAVKTQRNFYMATVPE